MQKKKGMETIMIHTILGRAGTGKSEFLLNKTKALSSLKKQIYVIVPEQFTFETERKYYRTLGADIFRNVKVISFSRLAHQIFKQYGGIAGDYADESVKLILMNLALHEVKDGLTIYGRAVSHVNFSKNILDFVTELKNANLSEQSFEKKITEIRSVPLKEKTKELSLVYSAYHAMLYDRYKDALDDISQAINKIQGLPYFKDCIIMIDEFKGFTAEEMELIRLMMAQAEQVYLALCMEKRGDMADGLFSCVQETYEQLRRLAQKSGARWAAPVVLEETHRFASEELRHLEQNLFQHRIQPYQGQNHHITAVLSANEYEETDYVLATIRQLVESGTYRYRDIIVVSRSLETYRHCLETACEKYDVPYYMDTLKSISSHPLIRLVELSLEAVLQRFDSQKITALFKCGLTGYSIEQASELENYVYLWDIKGAVWQAPFSYSIFGARAPSSPQEEEKQQQALDLLNQMRAYIINPLLVFKEHTASANGLEISRALLRFLEGLRVQEHLSAVIHAFREDTEGHSLSKELTMADAYQSVWKALGEMIEVLGKTIGTTQITLKRYLELFRLVSANYDLGTIPQTLDSISIGSAERIRTDCPKVLFILGVNDKVFPHIPADSGIYTDRERTELIACGFSLAKPVVDKIQEEIFIAYKTMTIPSEQLFLTARKADIKGSSIAPSYLYQQVKKMFGCDCVLDTQDIDRLYFCRTRQTAFSVLAHDYRQDNSLTASLKAYFSGIPEFSSKMEGIDHALGHKKFQLGNQRHIQALFGTQTRISPTRIEQYHKCKFLYFCDAGLKLKKREKVRLNALNKGLIIHEILCRVCREIRDFRSFDEKQVKKLIRQILDDYIKQNLGGYEHKTKRFLYLYHRISNSVYTVISHLFEELSQSSFIPADFEYQIGEPGNVPPLTIQTGEPLTCQGMPVHIQIIGTVDRVDLYHTASGNAYVRVIDYKSGTKKFKLSDLINGINLQMFLYLMCLSRGGAEGYQDSGAAGVLYMPAGELDAKLSRTSNESELDNSKKNHYRMNGVILNEEDVIKAMEPDLQGSYVPVSVTAKAYNKAKELKENLFIERQANEELFTVASVESLLDAQQLGRLFSSIERSIKNMVNELYSGNIEAVPLMGKDIDSCAWCDYKNICNHDDTDPVNEYREAKKKELLEMLEKEEVHEQS